MDKRENFLRVFHELDRLAARFLPGTADDDEDGAEVTCEHCGISYPSPHCTYDVDRWLCFACFVAEYHS